MNKNNNKKQHIWNNQEKLNTTDDMEELWRLEGGSNNNIAVMLKKAKLDQLTEISLSEMKCQQINGNKSTINKQF